jgi:hypothetical protein
MAVTVAVAPDTRHVRKTLKKYICSYENEKKKENKKSQGCGNLIFITRIDGKKKSKLHCGIENLKICILFF